MKKTLLYCCAVGILAVPTFAQNRPRTFDNFDTRRGVEIVVPTIAPLTISKNLIKKTASVSQKTTPAQGKTSLNYNVQPFVYTKLSMAAGKTMDGFTTGDATIDSYIVASSMRYNIDPLLIYAQMHQESSFKLKAISYKGARGLMQLMPATAVRLGVTDIYNPKQNIEGGIKYMRWLLDKFGGDVALALAGYNAGEGAVMKYGNRIPPYRETQEYVRRISARYGAITNPNLTKVVRQVSEKQAVKLETKQSAPLTTLERNALAIRLSDGRMRLVNQ
ncbi:MAG: lytic transglycosylase domain-containing protein [Pyrinomonadaceae bacterium]|nr:lytic transglycosylase domain-containing protein [Pyrinomonadaceae bacterium]